MDNTKLKNRLEDKVQGLKKPSEIPVPVNSTYVALTNNALGIIRENLKNHPLSFVHTQEYSQRLRMELPAAAKACQTALSALRCVFGGLRGGVRGVFLDFIAQRVELLLLVVCHDCASFPSSVLHTPVRKVSGTALEVL